MFELAADHDRAVRRYNLRPPGGKNRWEVGLKWLKEWLAVLWATKCRQFEAFRRSGDLPPLPDAWGPVESPHLMPCVVWLFMPQEKK